MRILGTNTIEWNWLGLWRPRHLYPLCGGIYHFKQDGPSWNSCRLRIFKIFVGQYFKTPFPVQPMKAIGGMAIAHPETITHGMIWGSGIFTAVFGWSWDSPEPFLAT